VSFLSIRARWRRGREDGRVDARFAIRSFAARELHSLEEKFAVDSVNAVTAASIIPVTVRVREHWRGNHKIRHDGFGTEVGCVNHHELVVAESTAR
jgi:hypothetical protein